MGEVKWHKFDSPEWLTHELKQQIVQVTEASIEKHQSATWLLSGGSSPKKLYKQLSKMELPWEKITCLLTDERRLPDGHSKTNAAMVWSLLLSQHPEVNWVPIWDAAHANLAAALEAGESRLAAIRKPFTFALLGMGPDGHTASLFPQCQHSELGLDPKSSKSLIMSESPQYPKQRISLTLPLLLDVEHLYLLIMGERKREVLEAGLSMSDPEPNLLPIHQLINAFDKTLHVYWSPNEKILK